MQQSKRRSSLGQSTPSRRFLFSLLADDGAAAVAEYALILAIVGTAIALAAILIGKTMADAMNDSADEIAAHNAIVEWNATHGAQPTGVRAGEGAFIKPAPMYVGSWYPIEFVAGPSIEALSEEAEDSPLTRARPIFVSKTMRVTLLPDPNFQIRPKSNALQETGGDFAASWQWDVKPVAEGTHTLIAQVDVLKRKADGKFQVFNRYSRRVSVSVGVATLQGVLNGISNAETVGDALTALLKSLKGTLLALAALIAVGFGLRSLIRRRRKHRPVQHNDVESGAEADPASGHASGRIADKSTDDPSPDEEDGDEQAGKD